MEKLIALLEITEHSLLKFLNKYTFHVHSSGGEGGTGVKFPRELQRAMVEGGSDGGNLRRKE